MSKRSFVKPSQKKARDGIAIKIWLLRKGITQAEIARATGVNKGLVSRTVNGIRNCQKVLDYLRIRQMPKNLL